MTAADLSDEQRAIVETDVHGVAIVEAGPGAGKTRVIVERALYLLRQGVSPRDILILTFTRAAALEIRVRIQDRLRELGARWPKFPEVDTLHGWSASLVRQHPERVQRTSRFVIHDDTDREATYRVTAAECGIRTWERARVSTLAGMDRVAGRYIERLRQANALDFDALEPAALHILEQVDDPRGYKAVLVDEAQDLTREEWRLVRTLGSRCPDLELTLLVGDPWQLIYEWRDVDPSLWEELVQACDSYFDARAGAFRPVRTRGAERWTSFHLTRNYRCSEPVVAWSNAITYGQRYERTHLEGHDEGEVTPFACWPHQLPALAADLRHARQRLEGLHGRSVAFLARSWSDVDRLARALREEGLSVVVRRRLNGPWKGHMGLIVGTALKVLLNPADDTLVDVLAYRLGDAEEAAVRRVAAANSRTTLLRELANGPSRRFPWARFYDEVTRVEDGAPRDERVALRDPFPALRALLGTTANDTLTSLGLESGKWATTASIVEWLVFDGQHNDTRGGHEDPDAIVVTTIHQAKGLEWDSVIVWTEHGVPPSTVPTHSGTVTIREDLDPEERRLLYVAATRARRQLLWITARDERDAPPPPAEQPDPDIPW